MKILERTFDLINNSGQVYTLSLLSHHTGFFYSVEGLGAEHDTTYQKIGETYDILKDEFAQGKISGIVFFHSKYPYHEYMRFAQFCQDTPLRIHYRTPVGDYYRDGMVSQIEKNEDGETAKAKITFTASSLWYKSITITGTNQVRITSDSNILSPCHIMIKPSSAATSIIWRLWDEWGEVDNGALADIPEAYKIGTTDTLHIRSDTNPYQIYKTSSGGTKTDLYAYSVFSSTRFIRLKKGYNNISCTTAAEMTVEARILYETV